MEELIRFLRVNKALAVYRKNLKGAKHGYNLKIFCEKTRKRSYISAAFSWGSGSKDLQFWVKLNSEWLIQIGEI